MFALSALLATALLVDVLATMFFAITVAYLLVPLGRRLGTCRASRWVASLAATVVATVGVDVMLAPLVVILFLRLSNVLELAMLLPGVVTTEFLGVVETVTLDDVVAVGLGLLQSVGHAVTTTTPVVLIKLTLFDFLMFALPLSGGAIGRTLPALVPVDYRGTTTMLDERARETLFTIYVLQAAITVGTFAIDLVVFWALGYNYVIMLATVATALQLISIAGPSVLLVATAAYHAVVDNIVTTALVVALLAESVDLSDAELHVDDIGGDGDERNESADDSVNPSQP